MVRNGTKKPIRMPQTCCILCLGSAKQHETQNILLNCHDCQRLYHQWCHFVPLFILPRKLEQWQCLLCQDKSTDTTTLYSHFSTSNPTETITKENQWEYSSRDLKRSALAVQLQQVTVAMSHQRQQLRLAQTTLLAYTTSTRSKWNWNSQELCQTYLKQSKAKQTIRQCLLAIQQYIVHHYDDTIDTDRQPPLRRQIPRYDSPNNNNNNVEDDDLISLDELKCCICFQGDATDENDVILCDGKGCFRAHHMHCLPQPILSEDDLPNDWFCPLCTTVAQVMHQVQQETTDGHDDDSSWDEVDQVFPEANNEYDLALNWKQGTLTPEKMTLLATSIGIVPDTVTIISTATSISKLLDAEEEEDDNDDDFDGKSINEDASSCDSDDEKKTFVIAKEELDALSSADEQEPRCRRRQNTKPTTTLTTTSDVLDSANIIIGKRHRNMVDYRRLNDAMFGTLSVKEMGQLDDDMDEFEMKKKKSLTDGSSSSDGDSNSDNDGISRTSKAEARPLTNGIHKRNKKKNQVAVTTKSTCVTRAARALGKRQTRK